MANASKPFVDKGMFDTLYDLCLFSWSCPEFNLSLYWRNFMSSFKSSNKDILLPSPDLLSTALLDYCNKGNVEKLFALDCISFHSRVTYIDGLISVSPGCLFYVSQFIKAYSKFYNSFNKNNFIIK